MNITNLKSPIRSIIIVASGLEMKNIGNLIYREREREEKPCNLFQENTMNSSPFSAVINLDILEKQ